MKADASFSISKVALTVHDIERVGAFYRDTVGLVGIETEPGRLALGAGGVTLLELREDKAARPRSPREAGLFHTAFLLPARADLSRWTRHAIADEIQIAGASDHLVSEAIYLSDPEGNGVEIYADRPRENWVWSNGAVEMATDRLDFGGLLAASGESDRWAGFPEGSMVGHVHLQVGAIREAEAFYAGEIGLDVTCRYPGGSFFSAGGYHHHVAANVWNSRGAGVRTYPSTGLAEIVVSASGALGDRRLHDPWGSAITFVGR